VTLAPLLHLPGNGPIQPQLFDVLSYTQIFFFFSFIIIFIIIIIIIIWGGGMFKIMGMISLLFLTIEKKQPLTMD
jgi:hypothetical protein